jgi:hypothetical protein
VTFGGGDRLDTMTFHDLGNSMARRGKAAPSVALRGAGRGSAGQDLVFA